jgi:cell division protein FtsX
VSNSDKTNKERPKRRRIPFLMRATFAGLAIALTSLWALTVSYDISREELLGFLVGSVLLLLGVLLTAALLVSVIKILAWLISRLRKPAAEDETQQD